MTFETNTAAKLFASLNDSSFLSKVRYWMSCCQSQNRFKFYHENTKYSLKIRRAPEPEDIVWTNIGVSDW